MEIIFGILAFFVWLGVLLYMLILAGGIVFYILYVIFGVIFIILEKLFKSFHVSQNDFSKPVKIEDKNDEIYLSQINFSKYEKKIKTYEIKSIKYMIKRAKNTKIYLYSGIVMIVIFLIFEFLFFLGVMHNEYLWSFWIFGLVCLFFGVYYLKIYRRFYEKRL